MGSPDEPRIPAPFGRGVVKRSCNPAGKSF